MSLKICAVCAEEKPENDFYRTKVKDDDGKLLGYKLYFRCKVCERAYQRHRYATFGRKKPEVKR